MNLQFSFRDSGTLIWTDEEKKNYVNKWEKTIKNAWGNRILKHLKDGRKIVLVFKFKIDTGNTWLSNHWDLSVSKTLKPFETSYVEVFYGNTVLDNKDFIPKPGMTQRGAVHVMHHGEVIMSRHLIYFKIWLEKKLSNHRIQ